MEKKEGAAEHQNGPMTEKERREQRKLWERLGAYVLLIGLLQLFCQAVFRLLLKDRAGGWLLPALAGTLCLMLLLLLLAWRGYLRLHSIARGIRQLPEGAQVHLPEEGVTEALARSINQTSDMLEEQRKALGRRDTARIDWIRGISHDIRTPLSMVMGYAELLEEDPALSEEQQQSVAVIKEQSLKMKALIEDLNLTSKLEYDRQPLRLTRFRPAELLRESVAGMLNSGYFDQQEEGSYQIDLMILPEYESLTVTADHNLLRRVFDNLIGNAFRHNPQGCSVMILAYVAGGNAVAEVRDDGRGIPEAVASRINRLGSSLQEMEAEPEQDPAGALTEGPHIMGMRIAKQIMLAHGGNLIIKPDRHTVAVILNPAGTE